MNNLYQPLVDNVFSYDRADEAEERSRAPLLVVIALAVLVVFTGVVWLAATQERGRQGASLAITAPEGPVRVVLPQRAPAATSPAPSLAAAPTQAQAAGAPPSTAQVAQAVKAPPPTAAAAAGRAGSVAVVLQLGAFESQELANVAFTAFRARYPSVAGLSPDVQRADLGAKGVVYRLRVGPFADRAAATNACTELKAVGANCFVAAP